MLTLGGSRAGAFLTAAFALVGLLSLTGCDTAMIVPTSVVTAQGATTNYCRGGAGVIGVLIDATASTNGALIAPGKQLIKQNLATLIARPECGRRLYVRTLTQDSWAIGNALLTAWIPPIGPEPTLAPKGIFEAMTHYRARLTVYRKARARVTRQRAAARAVVVRIGRQLDRLHIQVEDVGSDINGAFLKFGDLDTALDGPRSLLVLSDLQPAGPQSSGLPDMRGTAVSIVLYCGNAQETASRCQATKSFWQHRLVQGHARSVTFEDVSGALFITDAFS